MGTISKKKGAVLNLISEDAKALPSELVQLLSGQYQTGKFSQRDLGKLYESELIDAGVEVPTSFQNEPHVYYGKVISDALVEELEAETRTKLASQTMHRVTKDRYDNLPGREPGGEKRLALANSSADTRAKTNPNITRWTPGLVETLQTTCLSHLKPDGTLDRKAVFEEFSQISPNTTKFALYTAIATKVDLSDPQDNKNKD